MCDHTFINLQFTKSDIRPHIKCFVSLVIAYGYFNLPQGFVWVGLCMSRYVQDYIIFHGQNICHLSDVLVQTCTALRHFVESRTHLLQPILILHHKF